jgi:hypothetical protein
LVEAFLFDYRAVPHSISLKVAKVVVILQPFADLGLQALHIVLLEALL